MQSSQRSAIWTCATLFFGWFLFYWLTAPVVHVEADDAYEYAYDVETASFSRLLHPYHPLYLVLMRVLFALGKSIGIVDRSFPLMLVASAALAGGAVVVFSLILWKRLGVPKWPAIVAGGLLGFSYGFWRYAAEAETYALAFLLVLGLVWWMLEQQASTKHAAIGGLLGVLAVFGHVLNVIPALVSVPLYLALRNGKKHVIAYLTVFVFAFLPAGYAIWNAARVEYPYLTVMQWSGGETVTGLGRKEISTATAVFGHAVVSSNFLFVFPRYRSWVGEEFPAQRLEGEKLVGVRAWPLTGVVGSATLLIVMVAFGWTLYRGTVRYWPQFWDPFVLAILSWLVLYLATIGYLGTLEQPEVWLLALVPFWLLLVRCVYLKLQFPGNALLVLFLPAALLLHNTVAGMAMLKDPESDRHRLKAQWLLDNAGEKDVILTSESAGFFRYLRYYSTARVVMLHRLSASEVARIYEESMRLPDRVFVTGEVVDPPGFMRRSPEPWMSNSDWVVKLFRESTRQVHQDDWGGVFLLGNPQATDATVKK